MKTVLVTGCSSGYGRATAAHFLEQGWNVVATMRKPRLDLPGLAPSPRLRIVPLDVTDRISVLRAVEGTLGAFGDLDAVVNNAGIGLLSAFEATPDQTTREIFETNTFGVMSVTRTVIPHFRERRAGAIVNVTSSVVFTPMPLVAVYTASKAAVEGFTESLAYELAVFGVRAKLVEPGYSPDTAFTANGMPRMNGLLTEPYAGYAQERMSGMANAKFTTDRDVAEAVLRAATDESPRLRYPAGADAEEGFALRRTHPGESYLDALRDVMGPRDRGERRSRRPRTSRA